MAPNVYSNVLSFALLTLPVYSNAWCKAYAVSGGIRYSPLWLFGPAPLKCRPNCLFRPLSVRRRQDCSSPVLSGGDVDCRTRLCIRRSPSQPAAAFPMNGARSVRPWADYARRARQILTLKRENLMIQNLSLAVDMTTLLAVTLLPKSTKYKCSTVQLMPEGHLNQRFCRSLWQLRQILSKRSWPQC